ncbi:MAG: LegC family aminotransferase [Lachnospiraceae bacterium]|nr:LegC family aminotransferase [Lachnospiraceae bacterium]
MGKFIPLSIPNFEGNERKYVDQAVDEGWVSTGGAFINTLEANMTEFLEANGVAACQSGTAALHLSLIECGITPDDMVIVPTLTFIAAVNPVRYQFAEPVFMDCDDSLCLDPVKLKRFCEEECHIEEDGNRVKLIHNGTRKHVKALVVVHVFGNMADMEAIMDIADKYGLYVIEDATEALGTYYTEGKYAGKYAGTIGHFGAYSFNGNKIITTGGGGAVTASSKEKVDHIRYLSTQAKDDPHYYIHNEVGYNYRMTNVQAAIGVAQLEELDEFILRKNSNYEYYKELLKDNENCILLPFRDGVSSNKWFYSIFVNENVKEFITSLEDKGVQSRAIWGLIHEQVPYRNCIAYQIEKAKYYSEHIVNIPCSTNLSKEDIEYVSECLKLGRIYA